MILIFLGVTLTTCRRWLIKMHKAVACNFRMSMITSIFMFLIQVAASHDEQVFLLCGCCSHSQFPGPALLSGDLRNLDTLFGTSWHGTWNHLALYSQFLFGSANSASCFNGDLPELCNHIRLT
jgi:hypothetical protein